MPINTKLKLTDAVVVVVAAVYVCVEALCEDDALVVDDVCAKAGAEGVEAAEPVKMQT